MKYTALVTIISLVVTLVFGARVGMMRARFNIEAPSLTGSSEFERAFRIHMNTVEQLVLFIPVLWLSTSVLGDLLAAGIGSVWVVGRVIYADAYLRNPASRRPGMIITLMSTGLLMLATLWGIFSDVLGLGNGSMSFSSVYFWGVWG
jgi:glutathione S-transferase